MVERRNALADATPSIWPAHGWLTSRIGFTARPDDRRRGFPRGTGYRGRKGPADLRHGSRKVSQAGYQGAYGNLVIIDHGFGLETKVRPLCLPFGVKPGQSVKRGDVIGRFGATGRATGYHLHYEVRANGRLLNPLQLLTQQKPRAQ